MRTCSLCNISFARPYHLRRHMETKHPLASPLPLERRRGSGKQCQTKYTDKQFGKGYTPSEDEMDQSSDDGVPELPPRPKGYVNSPNGRRRRDIFDDDSDAGSENDVESDKQSDDGESYTGSDVESNSSSDSSKYPQFQPFYDQTIRFAAEKEGKEMTVDERRKYFRKKVYEVTATYFELKKDSVFKKIMETVNDLKSGPGGYDMSEALERGFKQRKHLLDRVYDYFEEQDEGRESDSDDDSNDDEEEEVDRYTVAKEFPSVYS